MAKGASPRYHETAGTSFFSYNLTGFFFLTCYERPKHCLLELRLLLLKVKFRPVFCKVTNWTRIHIHNWLIQYPRWSRYRYRFRSALPLRFASTRQCPPLFLEEATLFLFTPPSRKIPIIIIRCENPIIRLTIVVYREVSSRWYLDFSPISPSLLGFYNA